MDEINVEVIVLNETNVEVNSPSASVNAVVNLPAPLESTTNSPSIDYIANVIIPSSQGPAGPIGPSGATAIINTGELDRRYVSLTGDQFVSGIKIFGKNNNYTGQFITIAGGCGNNTVGTFNVIGGGNSNIIKGIASNIIGGDSNIIDQNSDYSNIGGGSGNYISKSYSNIAGGLRGRVCSACSNINGGNFNCISSNSDVSVIGGGFSNYINGPFSNINGGASNTINGCNNSINGGQCNIINLGCCSNIVGGLRNCITSNFAFIGGGQCSYIFNDGATVLADQESRLHLSCGTNTISLDFRNGAFIPNGNLNVNNSGVFGGVNINNSDTLDISGVDINIFKNPINNIGSVNISNCIVSSNYPIYGSNLVYNTGTQIISGNKTFFNNINVSGTGNFNSLYVSGNPVLFLGVSGSIDLGFQSIKSGTSSILAGVNHSLTGDFSVIIGGHQNRITNSNCASILGGYLNCVSADYGVVLGGRNAEIVLSHTGAVILNDAQDRAHKSKAPHSLTLDFASGIYLQSSITGSLIPATIQNYLKVNINSDAYYIPMYKGAFTPIL